MLEAIALAALIGSSPVPMDAPTCDLAVLQLLGFCPSVDNDGSEVGIGGEQNTPGTDPVFNPGDGTDEGSESSPPPQEFDFETCLRSWSFIDCFRLAEEAPPAEENEAPGIRPITISDLAQFAPAPAALAGEPDNVGIAGMPTNFVTNASTTTQTGTLFGRPISVRFTPTAYDFHYGDGSTTTTTTGGDSWAALGQAQFTPTSTSHAYQDRGIYAADVDIRYGAEIDFGTGWFPITGELTTDGPPQQIRIFEAHTALVAHTCNERPDAPGC